MASVVPHPFTKPHWFGVMSTRLWSLELVCILTDIPLPFQMGTVVLVVQAWGGLFSATIRLNRSARKVAPRSQRVFQTPFCISSGLVALPLFIFSMASFTSAIMIKGTRQSLGGELGIGGCGNSYSGGCHTLTIDEG